MKKFTSFLVKAVLLMIFLVPGTLSNNNLLSFDPGLGDMDFYDPGLGDMD
ncbi:hypothetical protein [Oceanobacillus kapialis]|uniref:Secreted protein n=2 Tax=Bacillati TaxID=1783272 RepID=A0ABP4CCJ9_9ACTN